MGVGRTIKIDKKWRIVLPKEVRQFFKVGDLLQVEIVKPGHILLKKASNPEEIIRESKKLN